ncbi:Gfo/Idh/MocA family protein [Massilia cavernae]|uniref:Gfo/Idh/MocA family oxidoreductase n=1 Tax=Massilia cavernae TaxID=2320864 RepID=A0A418Y712_9BURK|nr:Gfo/Idh/MocA family oxidoreductase [Massilia cavernae]RJG25099.1 gfo/Idh/MocA family oxidoreductase [Massilia cavernae]
MTDLVRWGILGTGKIARAFATALKDTPGAVLTRVGSRNVASAESFGSEFGLPMEACHGSYQAIADAEDVDIIYIATPHTAHAANAIMALGGGKAVLCEKPFAMNRREAAEVVALARAKKLFLMEAMWTRFLPALDEVKRIIASGEIGAPVQVTADFGFAADVDPDHRLVNPELGGGALLDLGIYPLSIAAALLGPVSSVRAQAEIGPTGVDVQTGFVMVHEGGAMSVCSCSIRARTPAELTVSGQHGHVRMNTMFHRAKSISVSHEDGSSRTVPTPYVGNGYAYEAVEAGRCLREGLLESPHMTLDETLALMGVLDTIREQIGLRYVADA